MALIVVFDILASQSSFPFVVGPFIYPRPFRSPVFAGAASSPVMWLGSVCRAGVSLVLVLQKLLIQSSLMFPPRKTRTCPQSPRRLLILILRLPRILFRLVHLLSRLDDLPRRLSAPIKSSLSASSASPCPCRVILYLPGVLLKLIVSSMVSCPSGLSLSASVILLSPMFLVLFWTTRKSILLLVKVNLRTYLWGVYCMNFYFGRGSIPRRVWRAGAPLPFLARTSGGHCTHPTGGPSFAFTTKTVLSAASYISSCNTPTEKISVFVDSQLEPLVSQIPSFVTDTNHFFE